MSKSDEYRANAQECQRMAGISRKPEEKAVWQQMAQDWLRMIPKNAPSKPEHTEPPRQTKTEKQSSEKVKSSRKSEAPPRAASMLSPTEH